MKSKIKIVADDKIPFLKGVLEPFADIEYHPGDQISHEKVKDADALIIRTRTKCNEQILKNTNIKLITTATIGFDHIDIEYCKKNNIKWINAPGCNSSSVMQYVAAALFNLAEKNKFYLQNKTIGIVGVGNVGRKIQRIAQIFEMEILLNDPPRQRIEGAKNFCSLETIMKESDIISFHVPLNHEGIDKTYHLAGEEFFNNLDKNPIIINTSRGEVIETSALKKAILDNKIESAVLDVWENEPEIDLELLKLAAIATPHIAGYSADGKANGTSVCVNAVNSFFDLGLTANWYPQNIPLPETGNEITIDGKNKYDQEIFSEAIKYTYDVGHDNAQLKNEPQKFEYLRGSYKIRREFNSFDVRLLHCHTRLIEKLIKLNFNIKCN